MKIGELTTDEEHDRSRQFTLVDVFALLTLLSILFAIFAPLVRFLNPEERVKLLFPLAIQLLVVSGATAYAIVRRRALVEEGGRRLGVAFFGTAKWSGWLPIKSICWMAVLAVLQMFMAYAAAATSRQLPFMLLYTAQLAFIFATFGVNLLWRVYPGTLEFFENGVAAGGLLFHWPQVAIRDSQFFEDRVGVVLQPPGSRVGMMTRMTRVSDALRREIEERAAAE